MVEMLVAIIALVLLAVFAWCVIMIFASSRALFLLEAEDDYDKLPAWVTAGPSIWTPFRIVREFLAHE